MNIKDFLKIAWTPRSQPLTLKDLRWHAKAFHGKGGVSEENRSYGFTPAFLDTETDTVYRARFADGREAPMHVLDGLPEELIVSRRDSGAVTAVKATIIAGFMHHGQFFTRGQAAQAIEFGTPTEPHKAC